MVPSASVDASLKVAVRPLTVTPKFATGGVLPLTAVLIAAAYCALVPCALHCWMSSYNHMNPPLMPALVFQLLIRDCTVAGLSPDAQPLPCLDHKPGATVMPMA